MGSPSLVMGIAVTSFAVSACGSVSLAKPDAGKSDAAVDADLIDADLTGVAQVVTHSHIPGGGAGTAIATNITVVSVRPNGTVADMVTTDATGMSMIHVYPGGSVTAIYPHTAPDMGNDFATFMGVKPGDTLNFGRAYGPVQATSLGTEAISWPSDPAVTNGYCFFTPCGEFCEGQTTTGSISNTTGCDREPMQVEGIGFTVVNSRTTVAGFSQSNFTFQSGGSVGLNGWATPQTMMINLTGLPTEVQTVEPIVYNVANGGTLMFGYAVSGSPTGGAYSTSFAWPTFGDRTFGQLELFRQGVFSEMEVMDSFSTSGTSWTVASPTLPPWVSAAVTSAPAGIIMWFPVPPITHDGTVIQTEWTHQIGATNYLSYWDFIVPPDQTTINLPKLPPPYDTMVPQDEDSIDLEFDQFNIFEEGVQLLELPSITSYDELRALPEAELVCPDCAVRNGTVQRVVRSQMD